MHLPVKCSSTRRVFWLNPGGGNLLPKLLGNSPDRRRLAASLLFNFIAKVPGVAAVFIILPSISQSLGVSLYGEFLSAFALGSAFTLPFGGINAVGRRLLAMAVGESDRSKQADVFVTTTFFVGIVAVLASAIIVATTASSWTTPVLIFVSLLPIIAGFFNAFDNARASYNEHFVTALFQLMFQITIYALVYAFGVSKGDVLIAGLALQSPYLLASVATMVLLVVGRPFLIGGRVKNLFRMMLPAIGVTMADGSISILLNLSVYWLKVAGHSEYAAWVGTFTRLFQSFMSPILLILFPVSTYISMQWGKMDGRRRLSLLKYFILFGGAYGAAVGTAMAIAGPYYINHMFKLTVKGDSTDVLCLSLFLGAVIAQKSYTMLLYAVSEARFVSFGTTTLAGLAILLAAVSRVWLSAAGVIDVLFAGMGVGLPILLLVSSYRYMREVAAL